MKCRVCKNPLLDKPLIVYEGMPSRAQNLPDRQSVKDDFGVDLGVYQCSGCGLVQMGDIEPVSYFREVIRSASVSKEMSEFRNKQFLKFVQEHKLKRGKVIEIGCGQGEYLSIMADTGVDAYGIEFNADSVKKCTKNGLKVQEGFIGEATYKISSGPFKAFFMLNFLEHLPDPGEVLRGIANNLESGAVGLVEVPNFDMILKSLLFSEFMRDHLFYFTKDSLTLTLQLNGFEVLSCEEVWHNYSISAVVKKRTRLTGKARIFSARIWQKRIATRCHYHLEQCYS